MGLSVISHPKNPYIPTSHLNIRLFCILDRNKEIREWWAGGGYDLTPYISFKSDNIKWHDDAKALLNSYNKSFYKKFSKNCNEYFYIPHRNERRGVGGIFFDNFTQMNLDKTTEISLSKFNFFSKINSFSFAPFNIALTSLIEFT